MASIGDSSAVREDRVLVQHQAALTLIQSRLSEPDIKELRWLDLACGRGQIIAHLGEHFTEEARRLIRFHGYDIDQNYGRETERIALKLGFLQQQLDIGELSHFNRIIESDLNFDFITLTNTVHELSPHSLSRLLLNAVARLSPLGTMFIYDMEQIQPPELGAIPWSRDDVRIIIFEMLDALGSSAYRPQVSRWQHSRVSGWNVQIDRRHIKLDRSEMAVVADSAATKMNARIKELMVRKLRDCKSSLTSLTAHPPETADEQLQKVALLHELWALTRALEAST
ncbi:MAG TPA: class I SAM-dependent methyltransferase [Falsiroseomonas sp.]|jgi:SAM-dependent methyltransferase|nr:class I SAM-dependent methyltransferase [Falsiroseomonas sp.]